MTVNCPHCGKQLKLSEKIRASLAGMEPGRKIKVRCIHCSSPFGLDSAQLFPANDGGTGSARPAGAVRSRLRPPAPPDVSWLQEGTFAEEDVVEDIPRALVLMPEHSDRQAICDLVAGLGYQVETGTDPEETIDKMRFINYAAVFYHTDYEQGGMGVGRFHHFMKEMDMSRRRFIFYVLIGRQFETLYDLQALVNSANLVVNERDIPHLGTVLKKAIPEYERLFGPLMEELQVVGR